jgi:hypothetical protein
MIGKKQVICRDAERTIFGAFRVIKKLVCHLAHVHGEEATVVRTMKEHIGITVWTALLNFVIGLNSRSGLWELGWTSTFQRDVEGMRLCSPILDFVPWDSRPGKLHKMTVFRPHIAMQPSDLAQLCAKKGNPLARVSPNQRGDQLVILEKPVKPATDELDKAFQDGLILCVATYPGFKSSCKARWSPAQPQSAVEQNEEPVWLDGLLDQHFGTDIDKDDEGDGGVEDDNQAVDELEAERKAASIVGRFGRYCIFRFAVAKIAKESGKALLPAEDVNHGAVAFLDPYQRSCRYSMLVEQKLCLGNTVRNGLYNMCGPILVLDDLVPHYSEILGGLCRFRDLYLKWICHVLIGADLVGLELASLAQVPLWRGNLERTIEIEGMQEALDNGVKMLETFLFVIDQRLMWPWAMHLFDSGQVAGSGEPDVLEATRRLEEELVPQARGLVNELVRHQTQLVMPESGESEQGISSALSLLPLGAECRAQSYHDGLLYSARVLAYTDRGYLVEFQQDQAEMMSNTIQQDTHRSDVLAVNSHFTAPPRETSGWACLDESLAVGHQAAASSVQQVDDEGAFDPAVEVVDSLGWLEEKGDKGNQNRVRRFGRWVWQPSQHCVWVQIHTCCVVTVFTRFY